MIGVEPGLFTSFLFTNKKRDRLLLFSTPQRAKIRHVWPHSLRKAAGQFLIDQHAPLGLVSRVMGHADTRITDTVYARVRDEDLGDRMLAAVDA